MMMKMKKMITMRKMIKANKIMINIRIIVIISNKESIKRTLKPSTDAILLKLASKYSKLF